MCRLSPRLARAKSATSAKSNHSLAPPPVSTLLPTGSVPRNSGGEIRQTSQSGIPHQLTALPTPCPGTRFVAVPVLHSPCHCPSLHPCRALLFPFHTHPTPPAEAQRQDQLQRALPSPCSPYGTEGGTHPCPEPPVSPPPASFLPNRTQGLFKVTMGPAENTPHCSSRAARGSGTQSCQGEKDTSPSRESALCPFFFLPARSLGKGCYLVTHMRGRWG